MGTPRSSRSSDACEFALTMPKMARARHLVLFHHEPAYSDATIEGVLNETRRFEELTRDQHALRVSAAYDGLEVDL